MSKPSFFTELQRRHVYKVGAMYAVAGWLLVQIVTQVFPIFHVSELAQRIIVIAVIVGAPIALVLAWLFDITPQGIIRTEGLAAGGETTLAAHERHSADRKLNYLLSGLLLISLGYVAANRSGIVRTASSPAPATSRLSIAVLPFENLSDEKANAYFAVGMQDEILTRLSKIGALKVISRTSTSHYVSSPDNLPEIARQLGVENILEGSVQKAGDAVRINVQLIHAADDDHLWAESYDRKLDNIFDVEGEVAGAIAQALKARLSVGEQKALATLPTQNAEAYDNYLRGVALQTDYDESRGYFLSLIDLYTKAVTADPNFAQAWAELSAARTQLYFVNDHTPQQLAGAKAALDTAMRLQPELPEAWMALGFYRYWGEANYDGALQAYAHARELQPNNPELLERIGLVKRRQGLWEESLTYLHQSVQLDPRNSEVWANIGFSYRALRRFAEARDAFQQGLEAQPGNQTILASKASSYLAEGNTDAAAALLAQVPLDLSQGRVVDAWGELLQQQRQFVRGIAAINAALAGASDLSELDLANAHLDRGLLETLADQRDSATADFEDARGRLEAIRRAGNSSPGVTAALGLTFVMLDSKAAALDLGRQAVQQSEKDAFALPPLQARLALIEMRVGENESAIDLIEKTLSEPGGMTVEQLRLDAIWDPLRSDPRFRKLIANSATDAKARAAR